MIVAFLQQQGQRRTILSQEVVPLCGNDSQTSGMWRASSDSVIFPIPGDEARNALFDAGGRPEAQIALYCRDVGKGIAHVSWLHRQESLLGLTSARRLYPPDQTGEFFALVVAYII